MNNLQQSFKECPLSISGQPVPKGSWVPSGNMQLPSDDPGTCSHFLSNLTQSTSVVLDPLGKVMLANGGCAQISSGNIQGYPLMAWAPSILPQDLGSSSFKQRYGIKYAYVTGSMAQGIASYELVKSAAFNGMLGFFGSAGLAPKALEETLTLLKRNLGDLPYGVNLINSPNTPELEQTLVDMFIKYGVNTIEASAYLTLSLPLLRYRYYGIRLDELGNIYLPNRVIAKISRAEVAEKFLMPPSEKMLKALVDEGTLSESQAILASKVPVASDVTAEADSGGHTDNRPAISLIPSIISLRNKFAGAYKEKVHIGAAGGISTPGSAATGFAMGADYVVTGSVNQACVEAGTSLSVRQMLAKASPADVTMAPAADMFEMGVNLQVLKWGTMFPGKARKLYELYRSYDSIESLPQDVKQQIENQYLKASFEDTWESTKAFFMKRDSQQVAKAEKNPKYKMALLFRSYLGQTSRWAISQVPDRRNDYQIWCGPAMGAFNQWAAGSFFDDLDQRTAHTVAMNLLVGACYITRINILKNQGLEVDASLAEFAPRTLDQLSQMLQES